MGKFNISKTSKSVNLSTQLLRHYEHLGLIEPERGENGYRFFSVQDLDKLQGIRRFRNMGFSLSEMEVLMYSGDYAQVDQLYRQALDKADREILWKQEVRRAIAQVLQEWEQLEDSVGKFSLVDSPDILRVNTRKNTELEPIAGTPQAASWIDRLPAVFISPMFPKESILSSAPDIWFGYGVAVDVFERLQMEHIPTEQRIKSQRCVTTVIYSRAQGRISCRMLAPLARFCREQGLTICENGWGITLGNCDRNGETFRFHRVYVPVEEKSP